MLTEESKIKLRSRSKIPVDVYKADADAELQDFVEALDAYGCEPDDEKGCASRCPVCSSPHFRFKKGGRRPLVCFCKKGCSWETIRAALSLDVAPELPSTDSEPLPAVWFSGSIFEATIPGFTEDPDERANVINSCLFRVVRFLKEEYNLRRDIKIVARFLRRWRELAHQRMGDVPELETVLLWDDLWRMWPKVKYTILDGPLAEIFVMAESSPFPACSYRYECETTRRLVRLCLQQQYQAGDAPWYLTTRAAAYLFGAKQYTISRLFQRFVRDGILRRAEDEEIPLACRPGMRPNSIYYWFVDEPTASGQLVSVG